MALLPDFIQEFRDEIHDEKANKELFEIGLDFNKKWDTLQKSKNAQYTTGDMQKDFGIKPKIPNFKAAETALINEYKKKVLIIAKAHLEKLKFQELSKKHALELELESDKTMLHLGETQERMIDKKEAFKEKLRAELKQQLAERDDNEQEQVDEKSSETDPKKKVKKDELTQEEIKEIARRQLLYELKQRDSRETERER